MTRPAFKYGSKLSQDNKRWEIDKSQRIPVKFHQFSTWADNGITEPCAIIENELGEVEYVSLYYLVFGEQNGMD